MQGCDLLSGHALAERPRVLAVIDDLEIGGAQHHLLTLARGLAESGYDLTVATSGNGPLAASFEGAGVAVVRLAGRSIKHRLSPIFIARLVRLARRGSFGLIHGHLYSASLSAAVAARATGLPLVLTQHSMNTWQREAHCILHRWSCRQAGCVIAVSHNIATLARKGGVRPVVIPNAVPLPVPAPSAEHLVRARLCLGVPRDGYVVSYVGRLTGDKNPLLFGDMARLVAARCPHAHFLVVGDGPLRHLFEHRLEALGLAGRVTRTGFLPDAMAAHEASDVLVVTSRSEGCPLTVLEAMSRGRPVVATAVGAVPSQVRGGTTGFLADPDDAAALAHGVLTLADPATRHRFGAAALAHVAEHFPLNTMLNRTEEIYRHLMEQRALTPAHLHTPPLSPERSLSCRYRSDDRIEGDAWPSISID